MAPFTTKCDKCGKTLTWDEKAIPPPESNRAKAGKTGWWFVDGALHTLEECKKGTKTNIEDTDSVPVTQIDAKMAKATHIYAMALFAAQESVRARYPAGHQAFSQIRSDVARNYVAIYLALKDDDDGKQ